MMKKFCSFINLILKRKLFVIVSPLHLNRRGSPQQMGFQNMIPPQMRQQINQQVGQAVTNAAVNELSNVFASKFK